MSQPAEQRGRFCSVAPPARDGVGKAAFILHVLNLRVLPLCPSLAVWYFGNFPHLPGNEFDLSNRAMCRTEHPSQWRQLKDYTAHAEHGPTRRHATRARVLGKPDFPVGWSAVGRLFKGKSQAKEKND